MRQQAAQADRDPLTLVATYGTLRRGGANEHVIRQVAKGQPEMGYLPAGKYRMFAAWHGAFPFLTPSAKPKNKAIRVDLWKVPESALGRLDHFEGVSDDPSRTGLYYRTTETVETELGPVTAWVYLRNIEGQEEDMASWIGTGDWFDFIPSVR